MPAIRRAEVSPEHVNVHEILNKIQTRGE